MNMKNLHISKLGSILLAPGTTADAGAGKRKCCSAECRVSFQTLVGITPGGWGMKGESSQVVILAGLSTSRAVNADRKSVV